MAEYYGFQLRIDTTLNWYASNPRLALGEPGIDINLLRFKIGNGVDRWNELPYMNEDLYKVLDKSTQELSDKITDALNDISQHKLTTEQNISKFDQELKNYEARLDEILNGATTNSEILDARVDATGKTHSNLGANIRSIHKKLIDTSKEISEARIDLGLEEEARQTADANEATARKTADETEAEARAIADRVEAKAREAADKAESQTRKEADEQEALTREQADTAETQARKAADIAERQARENADQAEARARLEADTKETLERLATDEIHGKKLTELYERTRELKDADEAERLAREAAISQEAQTREDELSEIRDAAQKSSNKISDLQERTDDNANGILSTVLYLHDETKKRREISSSLELESAIRAQEFSALSTKLNAEEVTRAQTDEKLQAAITKETQEREKSFEALDIAERETFEKLTDEITARTEQGAQIKENLTQESSTRKEADEKLQAAITQETQARADADNEISERLTEESSEREKADDELRDGLTHERKIQHETAEFLRGEIDTLAGAVLNGQITFSQLTDELKAKILEEAETRKLRDDEQTKEISTIGENLTAETHAREQADREISKSLSSEVSERTQEDEKLRADLQNAEAIQRDTTEFLKDEINTLANALLAGQITFSQLADKIKAQITKLTGDVETLRDDLTDETAARVAKDDELEKETERLSEVDEALQHFIKAAYEYAIARGDFQQEQINDTAAATLANTVTLSRETKNFENSRRKKDVKEMKQFRQHIAA